MLPLLVVAPAGCHGDVVLLQRPGVSAALRRGGEEERKLLTQPRRDEALPPGGAAAITEGSLLGVDSASDAETWRVLLGARWHRWSPPPEIREYGAYEFFRSVGIFEWGLFGCAMFGAMFIRLCVLDRPAAQGFLVLGLVPWLLLAAVYNAVIWARLGRDTGVNWLAGYLLEVIFLVENVFIFQIVVGAFNLPKRYLSKVLVYVVYGQIIFEMVFFMGLAIWLRSFRALPYLLGVWLLCCGLSSLFQQSHESFDFMETSLGRAIRTCFGDRISFTYDEKQDGDRLLLSQDGKVRISLLGLSVIVMLLADFLLEIDVVLTKIEELPNAYVSFSSSAVAALGIPELFFLSQGLLRRFTLLRYGIGFVLCLFGAQMLLHRIIVLPPLLACCIVVGVLALSMALSALQNNCCPDKTGDAGSREAVDLDAAIRVDAS